ncbi:MAG TPA: sodium:proton exchanger [Chloroflexia bacterium]|nr:sodium:proton exchanger [Chloroflexia bacterium]
MNVSAALGIFDRKEKITLSVAIVGTLVTAIAQAVGANSILVFVLAAITMAALASAVGDGTDQLGSRFGPGATGVLQSALGNLPELFIAIFALRAGLVTVVQAALVGSILGNSLLVLGIAFLVGGVRHGTQRFGKAQSRMIAMLIMLSVAALAIPTLATRPGAAAAPHSEDLSLICAAALLLVFGASIPFSIGGGTGGFEDVTPTEKVWPLPVALGVLAAAGVTAAVVSDWFVNALQPTMTALHLSESFTGLVIVAIAGNAVENVVGVQMAARNQMDFAISVILNSSLQVALALIPALVILSQFIGGAHLTLILPWLLLASLGLTAVLGAMIVYDGESTWLEGVALIALYVIIAASFWWG